MTTNKKETTNVINRSVSVTPLPLHGNEYVDGAEVAASNDYRIRQNSRIGANQSDQDYHCFGAEYVRNPDGM